MKEFNVQNYKSKETQISTEMILNEKNKELHEAEQKVHEQFSFSVHLGTFELIL